MLVNKYCEKISEEESETFNSIVMNLLLVKKRSRPDIETSISFLCTRLSKNYQDNKKKLKEIFQFLSFAIDEMRVMGADILTCIHIWVYVANTTHPCMQKYIGRCIKFLLGVVRC